MTDTVNVSREVIEQALALVNDMSRFVGVMALQDYAALDAVPRNLSYALAAAPKVERDPDGWFGSGWYDLGGKRHTRPDLITGEQLDMNKVSEGPFNLYRHPAPASDELLEALEAMETEIEWAVAEWENHDLSEHGLVERIRATITKHKGPQS